ncbi:MAG TPA: hypothetical protein VKS82_09775 [Streptosporangiaceae bacterium]|nr:hypothetical protein [Streptosporangiaceae bacterium]
MVRPPQKASEPSCSTVWPLKPSMPAPKTARAVVVPRRPAGSVQLPQTWLSFLPGLPLGYGTSGGHRPDRRIAELVDGV